MNWKVVAGVVAGLAALAGLAYVVKEPRSSKRSKKEAKRPVVKAEKVVSKKAKKAVKKAAESLKDALAVAVKEPL